jgi:hypothetical protein
MNKIDKDMNVFTFRKELYDFANDNGWLFMSNDSMFIQGLKGTPWKFKVDEFVKEMNRIWDECNTIFKKGIEDGGKQRGVHEKYWFKEDFPLMLVSMKYGVTIFRYYDRQERQTRNKNTTMLSDMGTQVFFVEMTEECKQSTSGWLETKNANHSDYFIQSTTLFAFFTS